MDLCSPSMVLVGDVDYCSLYLNHPYFPAILLAGGGFLKGDGVGLAVIGEEVLPLGFEC